MVEGPGYDLERRIHWAAQTLVGAVIGCVLGGVGTGLGWASRLLEGLPASIALGVGLLWTTAALLLIARSLRKRRNPIVHTTSLIVFTALITIGWNL